MTRLTEIADERLGNALLSYETFDAWTLKWWSILVTIPTLLYGYLTVLTSLTTLKTALLPDFLPHTTIWLLLYWPIIALSITYTVWAIIAYTIMKLVYNFFKIIYFDLYKGL